MRLTADRLITRIHFGAMLLVATVALVFIWVVDLYQQRARLAEHVAELESRIHLNGSYLQQAVATLRQDTLFLARTPAVAGIMRARLNGGVDPRDNDLESSWVRRLQETLQAFSEAHPQYFQLRYIGVADGGRELVRVDRREGKIVVVPQAELQRKGDRDYFRGAVALKAGGIYLSDFSLERERGIIAKPPIPMLRAATPVFTPKGEVFGIVVINLAVADILEAMRGGLPPEVDAYVADRQGRYLAAPQPGLAFAFEFGDERRLPKDFPDLAEAMDTATSSHWPLRRVQVGDSRRRIAAERVHFDPAMPGNFVLLAYSVPELAWRPRTWPKPGLLATGLLAALLTVALVSLWLRRQLAPLSKLTAAAEAIAGGSRDVKLPSGVGEIRALSRAFRHMLNKVAERERDYMHLNADLEARVRDRTAQLRLAATVLENTSEGVMVVDVDGTIVSVNPAFTEITGYTAEEAVGQTPSILRSDHHDDSFYRTMLQQLLYTGSWQGEIWNRRKNGEIYPEWLTVNLIAETEGIPASYVAVFADVTEQRRRDERIRHLAFHDALTGLPNRSLLFDRLKHALRKAEREGHGVAVMFMDLDGFKGVNDGFGHEVGDRLLQGVAECLSALLRGTDTVARLGGDEFVILLENLAEPEDAAAVASTLIAEISKPREIGDHVVRVGASVGIALYPDDSTQADELMKYADTAMYAAKLEGKGTYRFFRLAMTEQASQRAQLETEIRRAIDGNELELYYQPQFSLVVGEVCGFEALLHWHHPERGLVKPEEFIALAEETGLIEAIGDWVLDEACCRLAAWQKRGIDTVLAINVSAGELHAGNLPKRIAARLRENGIRPNSLRIELDESVLMADPEQHVAALNRLREIGVSLAVDHFGTGYSNVAYLSRLPIDVLKIDRSFVRSVVDDEEQAQVVRTIVDLARSLHLGVVAEGIETEAQAECLRQAGCPIGQGFLFARPGPASAAETWLTKALSQT